MKTPSLVTRTLLVAAGLLSARLAGAEAAKAPPFHFFLPDRNWCLELDLRGYSLAFDFAPDLKAGRLAAKNARSRFLITAAISPATNSNSAAPERDAMITHLRQGGFALLDLKTYEIGDRAFLEYTLKEAPKGTPAPAGFAQRNGFLFMVHDGVWVDVHLSCVSFTPADAAAISAYLSAVTLNPSFQPVSFDYWLPGMWVYRSKDYPVAIAWLTRALAHDRRQPSLPLNQQLALIDNLGMAYGLSGDLQNARAVFRAGIAGHPDYPMFYYNLACTDAEEGKLDDALKNLRLTLEHKANMIRGEKLPDPTGDSSFKKYAGDPRFQEVARQFTAPAAAP